VSNPVIIGNASLYLGDCLDVMRTLPACSVDSVVTDPPYGIRFMGKAWDGTDIEERVASRRAQESHDASAIGGHKSIAAEAGKYDLTTKAMSAFQEFSREWATEAFRVLKPGGHLLSFSSARTYHRMTSGIEDAGFEIRDQIMWIFGSGFPKSHNLDGDHKGWGTALKPAHEPICVARKPLSGTVAANVQEFGTGAINIDECRIESEPMKPNTGKGALPRRNESEVREAAAPSQPHELGRWPANVIHDGSDEVLDNFPDAQGQQGQITGNEPTANGFSGVVKFSGMINRVASLPPRIELDKSAARFFYCAKTSKEDRNEGCENIEAKQYSHDGRGTPIENAYQRNSSNSHPTVKPTDLMQYLVRLVTPKGGIVLDPFMGSGSTGKACWLEGYNFISIEKEPEYFEIAKARVKSVPVQEAMFA